MSASSSTSGDYTLSLDTIIHMITVKLSSSNHFVWKSQMMLLISYQNLLPHIDGSSPPPEPTLTQDYSIWHSDDQRAIIILRASLSEEALASIFGLTTARQIWLSLEHVYLNASAERRDYIYRQLIYSEKGTLSVAAFGRKLKGYYDQLAALGYPDNERNKLHWLIRGLGDPFSNFIAGVRESETAPVFRDVLVQAEKHEPYVQSSNEATLLNKLNDPALDAIEPIVTAFREDLQYIQASSVNVSNFVTVKLSAKTYRIWNAQISGLIKTQELWHIISVHPSRYSCPGDKGVHKRWKYEELVKGWILGSMNEDVLQDFLHIETAQMLWSEVGCKFGRESSSAREEDPDAPDSLAFAFEQDWLVDSPDEIVSIQAKKRLYEAAVKGHWWKAKDLLKTNKLTGTEAITESRNTILHLAVEMGHNHFVERLLEFLEVGGEDIGTKNSDGRTALHIAAMVGNEYAAKLLLEKRGVELLKVLDNKGKSALDIAISHSKLNISAYMLKFLSNDLSNYQLTSAINAAIILKRYDLALSFLKDHTEYHKYKRVLLLLTITFPADLDFIESFIYPSFKSVHRKAVERCSLLFHHTFWDKFVDDILRVWKIYNSTCFSWLGKFSIILLVPIATLYPVYHLICLLILGLHLTLSMLYLLLWKVLAVTVYPIKNIEKRKKDYGDAMKILSFLTSNIRPLRIDDSYRSLILEAVRIGAYEVVDEILISSPSTIDSLDEQGHNIIQLAIINRSEKVYNLIHHITIRKESYRKTKDSSKNNLVHLAGRLAPSSVLSRTTGAALQLQRELLWYKEVEKFLSPLELLEENLERETPAMVFTREHQDLMKEGENWMKTTAESCSITAALIVTIVFAAAITVPGGSNQDSGIPLFRKETAFTIFALSNAFSLFTSATSLLLFLSILTARFSEKDFLVILPKRLILGLLTLFLSTTAMIVAFGAILFLVFCDQRPWMLAPIVVFACLPISVIVTIKLPLLKDLIQSTYFPIFGKLSYLESCKINKKNITIRNETVYDSE